MQFIAAHLGLVAALVSAGAVHAQPAPAASSPQPTERAQHDADKVFRMILQHADKPRRAPREEQAPAAAAPRAPAAKAAAAAPATAAPARAAEPRVTTSTPPAVPAAATDAVATDAGVSLPSATAGAASTSPSLDTAAAASGSPVATVAAPAATLAPVAVAVPRSLKLEIVSSVEPEFPARLVRSLGKGSVVVNFDVRPDGTVARTEVASSSHRGLNEAALAAVAAWRFKPISETLPGVVELKFEQ
jgi:TonB family protein